MKIVLTVLGLVNGGYMLADGIFVILYGKYIGSEKPGPWAVLFQKFNIDLFLLGPAFVGFGLVWLIFLVALWTDQRWASRLGIVVSIMTLWYLPFGTIVSICVLVLLLGFGSRLDL